MKKPIAYLTFEEWTADMVKSVSNATNVKPIGVFFSADATEVCVTFNKKVQGFTSHHYTDTGLAGLYGASYCKFNSEYGITLVFDSYDKVIDKDGWWKPKKRG